MPRVLVIGEALVDVVKIGAAVSQTYPGGSPLNVAVGIARLGIDTTLHTSYGSDSNGVLIGRHLAASGVRVTDASTSRVATSVSEATVDAAGAASYDFRFGWDPGPIDVDGYGFVHVGSLGAVIEPGASLVEAALQRADGLVSFDPNIRPALMPERQAALARIERIVSLANVVKASDEDIAWLYPGETVERVLEHWQGLGPRLVVATRGEAGVVALTTGGPLRVAAPTTIVADTIGAGDSFMAGLIAGLLARGFADSHSTLEFAARCAAITVSRPGADPPWRSELD